MYNQDYNIRCVRIIYYLNKKFNLLAISIEIIIQMLSDIKNTVDVPSASCIMFGCCAFMETHSLHSISIVYIDINSVIAQMHRLLLFMITFSIATEI